MRTPHSPQRRILILGLAGLGLAGQRTLVFAGGGGMGGATEITQLLNHVELVSSVAQEAQVVTNTLNQYATMIQNLKQIPQQLIGKITMPWQQLVSTYTNLTGAVSGVQSAFNNAYQMLQFRNGIMDALHLDPRQYLNAELQLAQTKGGAYAQQITRDLQTLQDAQTQAQNLTTMTAQIPAISGSVQGLQHLAMQSSIVGSLLMDLRKLTLERQIDIANDKYQQAQVDQFAANKSLLMLQQAHDRAAAMSTQPPTLNLLPQH